MVDHVRKAVRAAAVTDLTGLTTTGASVFTSRVSALTEAEIPGWYVMLRDERGSEDETIGMFARTGNLVLEGWAIGGDGLEDKLDTMAAEAEAAIYDADSAVMALLINFGPPTTQIDLPPNDGNAATRTGIVRILIPVTYRTAMTDPTTIV